MITQNAETNAQMVAINAQIGFVPVETVVDLVKRLTPDPDAMTSIGSNRVAS